MERPMRTTEHMEASKGTNGYAIAQHVALQLREIATASGYDSRGVKLKGKGEAIDKGHGRVEAYITWEEGPENWTSLCELPIECCCIADGKMLTFYD